MYAGFWKRFLAYVIDFLILLPIYIVQKISENLINHWFALLLTSVISWLYYSLTESSNWQGSPGKKLIGIKVIDYNGNKISFGKATGRYFSKILSALILGFGFFMIGFNQKKQGLHDLIASTLVLNSTTKPNEFQINSINNGNTEVRKISKIVLAGFDSNGHVIRFTFSKDDINLIDNGLIIGRDTKTCSFYINDLSVSRQHARIYKDSGMLYIEDLNSTNGTSINGRVVNNGNNIILENNDQIILGDVELSIGEY